MSFRRLSPMIAGVALVAFSAGAMAFNFATESTLREATELIRNLNAHIPTVPDRINQYIGNMNRARTDSDTSLTKQYGVARAHQQAVSEFGNFAVLQDVCTGSDRIPETLRSATDNAYRDADAFVSNVMEIGTKFKNRQQQQRYVHEVAQQVGDLSKLNVARDNLPEDDWKRATTLDTLILTQDDPPVLNDNQKKTLAGYVYEAYQKVYDAYKIYIGDAMASVTADARANIEFDKWLDPSLGDALLYDLPPPYEEVVTDPKTGKKMLSRKAALHLMNRARIENPEWWKKVGNEKNTTWQIREQTMIAALQLDVMVRILDRLDNLTRLSAIQASGVLRDVGNQMRGAYQSVVKQTYGAAGP